MNLLSRFFFRSIYLSLHVFHHFFIYLLVERLILASCVMPLLKFLRIISRGGGRLDRFHLPESVALICKEGGVAQRTFDIASGFVPADVEAKPSPSSPAARAGSPNADELAAKATAKKLSRFRYTGPLYGAHASTILSIVVRAGVVGDPCYTREIVEASPGIQVALDWRFNVKRPAVPKAIAFIVPGLNSVSSDQYIRSFVLAIPERNIDVVVINTRGYETPLNGAQPFHAGMTSDLRAVLYRHLSPGALQRRYNCASHVDAPPLIGFAFSMGGNVLSMFLSEEGAAVACVNRSLDEKKTEENEGTEEKEKEGGGEEMEAEESGLSSLAIKRLKSNNVASPRRSFTATTNAAASPSTAAGAATKGRGSANNNNNNNKKETDRRNAMAASFQPQILAGFAIGTPWSLVAAIHNLASFPCSVLYETAFLSALKSMMVKNFADTASGNHSRGSDVNLAGVAGAHAVFEYDEHNIAPLHGFTSAAHYYSSTQSFDRLGNVRVPLFAISSTNDSICGLARLDEEWCNVTKNNQYCCYMRLPSGGHLSNLGGIMAEFNNERTPLEYLILEQIVVPMLERLKQ